MDELPGGLSGGGWSWSKESSARPTKAWAIWTATVAVESGRTSCLLTTVNIECGRWTSVWQQECEAGAFIEPQSCVICLQHSRSASVISSAEATQAIAGYPNIIARSRMPASLWTSFTSTVLYKASRLCLL
jgi:hypothetical protein